MSKRNFKAIAGIVERIAKLERCTARKVWKTIDDDSAAIYVTPGEAISGWQSYVPIPLLSAKRGVE